jgi:hypothetical protein
MVLSAQPAPLTLTLRATPILSRTSPAPTGAEVTEGYLTRPRLRIGVDARNFFAIATGSVEGRTLERGEVALGSFGQGFADRRHPEAYVQEVIAGLQLAEGSARASIALGRGIVPFGGDLVSARPFLKPSASNHAAHIIERQIVVAALGVGWMSIEASLFNGDEPRSPGAPPLRARFGDSRAARMTWTSSPRFEMSGSAALLRSPAYHGGGPDEVRVTASARHETRSPMIGQWAVAELGRVTSRADAGNVRHDWLLVEVARCRFGVTTAARFERSDRPEAERGADPYRTVPPPAGALTFGTTRWTILTVSVSAAAKGKGAVHGRPFLELSGADVRSRGTETQFDPSAFYGGSRIWMASAGISMRVGRGAEREGRYGAARPAHALPTATLARVQSAILGSGGPGWVNRGGCID